MSASIKLLAKTISLLPLGVNQALGAGFGWVLWLLNAKPKQITESNIRLCFPDLSDKQTEKLVRESLKESGKQILECPWIWNRSTHKTQKLVHWGQGKNILEASLQSSKGTIVISPHVGNWEICTLALSQIHPFTYFYRAPRKQCLDQLLIEWRAHLGGNAATLDSKGIRKGLKNLNAGDILGILPDQEPDPDNGVFADFFQQPALTMTLLPKLAKKTGANLFLCIAERLPKARGWRFHVLEADEKIKSSDLLSAAAAVNGDVERCVQICPAQYLWCYKRFNTRPEGLSSVY